MKKSLSAAGPIAAIIAFKCPLCILAFAGMGAGLGSFFPIIKTIYWLIILALSTVFIIYQLRGWKQELIKSWILSIGLLGVAGLIYQIAAEPIGFFIYVPGVLLTIASLSTLFFRNRYEVSCCDIRNNSKISLAPCCEGKVYNEIKEDTDMTNKKRKIEIFTSGCPVCEPVVDLVKKTACPSCDVVVYDLNSGCSTNECRDKAKNYGINRVPAVVVDGKLLECCKGGQITEEALRAAGIGSN